MQLVPQASTLVRMASTSKNLRAAREFIFEKVAELRATSDPILIPEKELGRAIDLGDGTARQLLIELHGGGIGIVDQGPWRIRRANPELLTDIFQIRTVLEVSAAYAFVRIPDARREFALETLRDNHSVLVGLAERLEAIRGAQRETISLDSPLVNELFDRLPQETRKELLRGILNDQDKLIVSERLEAELRREHINLDLNKELHAVALDFWDQDGEFHSNIFRAIGKGWEFAGHFLTYLRDHIRLLGMIDEQVISRATGVVTDHLAILRALEEPKSDREIEWAIRSHIGSASAYLRDLHAQKEVQEHPD